MGGDDLHMPEHRVPAPCANPHDDDIDPDSWDKPPVICVAKGLPEALQIQPPQCEAEEDETYEEPNPELPATQPHILPLYGIVTAHHTSEQYPLSKLMACLNGDPCKERTIVLYWIGTNTYKSSGHTVTAGTIPTPRVVPGKAKAMYEKTIIYDPETRDFAMYLDGELVGFARTYQEAEVTLDQLVFELINGQYVREAA